MSLCATPPPFAGCWNGETFEMAGAVPLTDRGFRYGMAFFESLAIRNDRVEFLEAHLRRLRNAARQHGWTLEETALEAAADFLLRHGGPGPTFARLYLTAGDGAPGSGVNAPRLFAFGEARSNTRPARPYHLKRSAHPYLPLPGHWKRANYWANIAAWEEAKAAGADEALLFNPQGEAVSAAMANLFVVIGGQLLTPRLGSGARDGVIREWIVEHRRASGQPVVERALTPADLARATEAFLTSSWNGIVPVATLQPGPGSETVTMTGSSIASTLLPLLPLG
ncbi:MAG TPA: aminotransferase class IV [Chthoniobacteraceae bacterium]|nr:aminotransferase class IV [Chthoniobacteraceae bacterium]